MSIITFNILNDLIEDGNKNTAANIFKNWLLFFIEVSVLLEVQTNPILPFPTMFPIINILQWCGTFVSTAQQIFIH